MSEKKNNNFASKQKEQTIQEQTQFFFRSSLHKSICHT